MAILNLVNKVRHNYTDFMWHKETRTLSGEASELGWPIGSYPAYQIFDDACDCGFMLYNPTSGSSRIMCLSKVDEDPDYSGGWRAVEYVPLDPDFGRETNEFKLVVFND